MPKALDPKVKAARALARRNEKIMKLRVEGLTLKQIAERVGLTGPRVYKIVAPMIARRSEHTGQVEQSA